jgi:signal transduction histidine kinase/ligand-binding sensor domain-containing protein/DNA-binding response OmpR family regulator
MINFNRNLWVIITVFLLPVLPYPQSDDLQFEHVTVENGLSNNNVQCILQDRQGFMWFGTSDGLNRWDGYTVKIFTNDANDSNSISDNYITALHEDSSGLIWIGTSNGLNRFDPKIEKFTHYFLDQNNPNSISDDYTFVIFKDSLENIWIGTGHGLNRFNRQNDNFTRYFFPGQLDSVSTAWNNNIISAINESKDGKLLLATMNDFLLFDTKTEETTIIPGMIPEKKHWPLVYTIFKDGLRKLWIAIANQGIAEYNSNTGLIRFYEPESKNPNSLGINVVPTSFCEDKSGNLWIGTANQGLYIFDRVNKHFTNYKPIYNDEKKLNSDAISCIYKDKQGNIWIGTEDNGINMVRKWKKPFRHYVHDPQDKNSLASGEVSNFYEDKNGIVWITNLRGGVSLFDRATGNFTHITHNPQNPASLSEGIVYAICEDKYGDTWFATEPDLTCLNRNAGTYIHYRHNLENPKSHAYTHTLCCYQDQQGTMWFGTANAGLERFDRADGTFDHFKHDPADSNSISDNAVFALLQDKVGNFWIGTQNGLCQLIHDSTREEKFIRYRQSPINLANNKGKVILAIYEDRIGRLWIGTDTGLSLFDRAKKSYKAILGNDDLPHEAIWGILEDDQGLPEGKAGNLWLRTLRGIVKFNPETGKLRVYDARDGLKHCKSIKSGFSAFYKGKNGVIYSGGINSFTTFHPDSLVDNPNPPKIAFTDFKINYKTVEIGTNSPLKESITTIDKIKLDYHQNIISFEFAALDYTAPAKNQYAYKLEGVNPDWVFADASRRFASYTNLDPGEYTFRVKASNNDGVWNEEGVSVRIIITPPWWKTGWAYGLYLLLFVSLIYGAWRFQMNRINIRHQLEMEHLHAEKLKEVDRMKSNFFANISHEFRTPLTLILGPLERLLSRSQEKDSWQDMKIMQRSARRLQRLINQLLDLSKLEAGQMKLQVREENIVTLLRSFVQAFESLAKMKNIKLVFKADQEKIKGYIDREKLETIITNLLSNAFKFTPEGGKVAISVKSDPTQSPLSKGGHGGVEIIVSDTGSGIPADRLPRIFDRFYQIDNSYTRESAPLDISRSKKSQLSDEIYPTAQEGSGIGLALTKELVEFHKGKISVTSEVSNGTTFVIRLPMGKAYYAAEEIVDIPPSPPSKGGAESISPFEGGLRGMLDSQEALDESHSGKPARPKKSLPILLIVEDNPDMCAYIRSNLENDYRIIEAADGEEGFNKGANALPDLIISDVMMPQMDGFQLCAKLKTDPRTSHIPVILLTARAAAEDRIGGLETGADDYIIKPFNSRELQVRVRNLIEQRRRLRERYRKEGALSPREIATTSTDQKFLQRALDIIEERLSDSSLDTQTFSREIGMSRMQLHRKITALTDMTPKEFIRMIRLQRAAQLLKQKFGNITEVAYEVGFSNPAYFTECFRKNFGETPSKYLKKEALKS